MRKSSVALAALSAASFVCLASAAQASTVFNTSLGPPGVIFGLGNFNTHFAVTTADDGIQLGLKSKIRGDASDSTHPVDDVYAIALGKKVSFDFAVIPNGFDLTGATATLTILNLGNGLSYSFNPALIGDNNTAPGGAYENSEQLAFYPVDFATDRAFTYKVTLALDGVAGQTGPISVENVIVVGAGNAVPEPASWALMLLGFGGAGVALRRSRKAAAAATA